MADITHLDSRRPQAAASMQTRAADTVHCLLIPLHQEQLLLPNAAVAEVTVYLKPEPQADAPDWYLGKINWRERKVPLVSFEIASGGTPPPGSHGVRITVLNTLNANPRVPYIALLTQGIPGLKQVKEQHLIPADEFALKQRHSVAGSVKLDDATLLIPDIDDLEKRLERLQTV
jgi:chemosensory pili system protein ChpC